MRKRIIAAVIALLMIAAAISIGRFFRGGIFKAAQADGQAEITSDTESF
ncbi:MAG: hypothetical protein PUE85_03595 [Firmicutes bacterium]|nr:hypothetical protein [Bacillota bacterium]